MEFLPLIIIPIIYFLVALIKPYFKRRLPFNICAICVAVSATWLILLFAWLFGVFVDPLLIGILMGMSLTGTMYKMEKIFEEKNIRNFWFVRLVIIIGGFYLVDSILAKSFSLFIFLGILIFILIAIASFFFQGKANTDKDGFYKKLDDCC